MRSFMYTVKAPVGMHARHAGLLVRETSRYQSDITLTKGDRSVNAKGILALLGLGDLPPDPFQLGRRVIGDLILGKDAPPDLAGERRYRIERAEEAGKAVIPDSRGIFLIGFLILPGLQRGFEKPADRKKLRDPHSAADLKAPDVPAQIPDAGEGKAPFGIDSPERVRRLFLQGKDPGKIRLRKKRAAPHLAGVRSGTAGKLFDDFRVFKNSECFIVHIETP